MISSSARRAGNSGKPSRLRSFVRGLQVCILLGVSASCGIAIAFFISSSKMIPADMATYEAPEATIIYSSDLKILGRIYQENRTNVPLKDIPKNLRNATVAIEDSRFYTHSGIDLHGIARAIWKNLLRQRLSEGASTITQQLARNVYLTRDKSIQRKAQEVIIAILMERKFTKDKILELYMNQIYYGSGSFGVQAAARVYFGKDVNELDLSESAMIAGLPQKPSGNSPHENKEAAIDRRDVVLNRMAELGYITPQQRDEAKAEKLDIIPRATGRNVFTAPHFVDYVIKQLRERGYSDAALYKGLRVYTTLNYDMQKAAEKALREGVRRHERQHRVTEGCFVAIEPDNGYVRAMVGSVDPKSDWNRCTQTHRQPGSSFKPFVYTAALMAGMKPGDTILNSPYHSRDGKWNPQNYDGHYPSPVTMRRALAQSMNMAAIRVAEKVGINNVIKYANLMGVGLEPDYQLEPYLPVAIGGCRGLRPIDMASAYCTFANDGVYVPSTSIIRVTKSNGDLIEDYMPEGRKVIPEQINKLMDDMLRGVVTSGTGRSAGSISGARGKTGTTNNDVDAWWIGYVPHKLVAACWVGNDNNTPMRDAYGSVVCAPVWVEFMKKSLPIFEKIHKDDEVPAPKKTVKKPAKHDNTPSDPTKNGPDQPVKTVDTDSDSVLVTLCDQSRRLATQNCPSTHVEKYIRGQEPKSYCDVHTVRRTPDSDRSENSGSSDTTYVTVNVCADSGMLAGTGCPNTIRKRFPVDSVPSQECTQHSTR
ncbi:MAG: PBP1A family penicillin-binding protein [Armatimonadetes bacterium]|nr:PBP1A family penicillin-binding protein [Armatimonadota bacterium]